MLARPYAWECRCQSWAELVDLAESGPSTMAAWDDRSSRSSSYYDEEWRGTRNWEQAQSLALHGDTAMAERIDAFASRFYSLLVSKIQLPEPRYSTEGATIDIGRYLDGDPECMIYMDQAETEVASQNGKTVFISYNRMASGGYGGDILAARGATIAALVKLLELAGFRVALEIYGGSGRISEEGTHKSAFLVSALVKDYDQDLSLPVMAYAIGNPSSYRRHLFSLYEQAPSKVVAKAGRYGLVFNLPEDEIKARRIDLHISGADSSRGVRWDDTESATKWLLNELERLGVCLKDS